MVFHGHSLEEENEYKKMYEIPYKLGKFERTKYTTGISTTDIINRITKRQNK